MDDATPKAHDISYDLLLVPPSNRQEGWKPDRVTSQVCPSNINIFGFVFVLQQVAGLTSVRLQPRLIVGDFTGDVSHNRLEDLHVTAVLGSLRQEVCETVRYLEHTTGKREGEGGGRGFG